MPIEIKIPGKLDAIVTHDLPRQYRKMKLSMPETTVVHSSGSWGMCLHQQVQIENHLYSEQNIIPQTDMEIHFVTNEPAVMLQIILSENMQIVYPDGTISQQGRKIGMQYMSPETPYIMQLQAGQQYHTAYIGLSFRLLKELSNAFPLLSALLNTSKSLILPFERLTSFIRTELDRMKRSPLSGKALIQYARNRISDIVISYLENIHRKDKVLLYDNEVASLIDKVNSHPETNFSVAQQAQILGLPERTLEVAFKRKKGVTLQLYVQQQRIAKAKVLLLSSGRSVADIAFETGYSDPSYFNRVFKQVTGISPGKYRSNGQS